MKIAVALSGGVDSSVAALQLAEAGHELVGLFMKNWDDPDPDGRCPWEHDVEDALGVCERLGIPLNTIDLATEYRERVFALFLDEYRAGRTPNPDVLCNREIKFKAFLDHARTLGAERIATGHYARIEPTDHGWQMLIGVDPGKDQSYFLHALDQGQLAASLFPVGHLLKTDVRRIARAAGFGTADKRDSTGICFIGERPFREFMIRYLPAQPGDIQDEYGRVLGTHAGVFYYTLGQREGLGIGGVR
ncbi:MAG: tRNA 2-thiouridine(34) synthase MnmA, partial [Gammaproteobacteria bacterium]|nr:tRNA 2-thiouridine(34) synthase MnmA [Gammaproteobacteria bacterium]